MTKAKRLRILEKTKHLRFVQRGDWAYVQRANSSGVVCIVAVTPNDELLIVEQYRPPLDQHVIELPAGLAGDLKDQHDEPLATAAIRELEEETGYTTKSMRRLGHFTTSAGLTDETVTFFMAGKLKRISDGGGDDSEDITVHAVPVRKVDAWLKRAAKNPHRIIDARVYTGLYFLTQRRLSRKKK